MKTMPHLLYHTMSARTSRLTEAVRPPDPVKLLMCWGLLGVAAGTLLRTNAVLTQHSILLTQGFAVSDSLRTLRDVFLSALLPMLVLLAGMLFCGCSACGQPGILALIFSRGIAFGIAAADVFTEHPVRDGIVIAGVLILPYGFCSMLLLCCAAKHLLRHSVRMTAFLLHRETEPAPDAKQTLCAGLPAWLLLTVLTAGLHTLLIWQFNDRLLMP